jgi:hypothetical protein
MYFKKLINFCNLLIIKIFIVITLLEYFDKPWTRRGMRENQRKKGRSLPQGGRERSAYSLVRGGRIW